MDAVALILGAGDGLGAALVRKCAAQGLRTVAVRRDRKALERLASSLAESGIAIDIRAVDATDNASVAGLVAEIEADLGPIAIAVYNVTAFMSRNQITDLSAEELRTAWEQSALGGFLMAREVAKAMLPRGEGTLIFNGSTASTRGSANYGALAGGRAALRALTQSMAREWGPKGLHVAHVVIDGAIDSPALRRRAAERGLELPEDGLLNPDHIAEQVWQLHRQTRTAWTHELTLRPWTEKW